MNLLPLIQRPKRNHHFACPLTGTMFKTESFRTSSVIKSQISTISYPSPDISSKSKLSSTKTQHKFQKTSLQQENIDRNTQVRKTERTKQYHTIDSIKSKLQESLNMSKKQARTFSKKEKVFIFPEVEIIPLDLIDKYESISSCKVKLSLQKYFRMYFASNISYKSEHLIKIILRYIPLMKEYKMLDEPITKQKWPPEFWQIKTTEQLINMLSKYDKNSVYWAKYVGILLSLYCIPDKAVRSTSLDSLILLIKKHLTAKMQTNADNNTYILLKQDGTPIQDFLDIQFSTTRLYFALHTDPSTHRQSYLSFLQIVKKHKQDLKKAGFMGRLKSHFRNEIVQNKCEQGLSSVNYKINYGQYAKQKNIAFNRALRLLQIKKQRSKNNLTALSSPLPPPSPRPKSKESVWIQENIEDNQSHGQQKKFNQSVYFQANLGKKSLEKKAIEEFKKYHELSKCINPQIGEGQIYVGVIQNNHPIISNLAKSQFHSMKLPLIFSILLRKNFKGHYTATTPMKWLSFVQLFVICYKNIKPLLQLEDCYRIIKNFVEEYLQIRDDDYFRQELAAKIIRISQGDKQSVNLIEEVVWSWLCQNGFVKHEAVQKQLLWTFSQRSKTFYLLIVSMILGTFKTTPLDLAHQLLL